MKSYDNVASACSESSARDAKEDYKSINLKDLQNKMNFIQCIKVYRMYLESVVDPRAREKLYTLYTSKEAFLI